MILYFVFCIFCLFFFIFQNWFTGKNLQLGELISMIFIAVFPIANVLVLLFMCIELLIHITNHTGVILKGRNVH